jgi:hypothetical protein
VAGTKEDTVDGRVTQLTGWRELAHRATTFIEVSLLWRETDNCVLLRVVELTSRVEFELRVRPDNALDAFHHPYAYLPGRLLEPGWLLAA